LVEKNLSILYGNIHKEIADLEELRNEKQIIYY
jgi:hypothetical protein